jgi:hypothetical protein
MITIATFSRLQDADLARTRLEAAGIPTDFLSEASDVWVLGAAPIVGGVRLQVEDADADRARELLADTAMIEPEPPKPSPSRES